MTTDETTRLEEALHRALRESSAAVQPPERLDDILRNAHRPAPLVDGDRLNHDAERPVSPTAWRTWVAAAAAAAVVVGGAAVGSVLVDGGKPPTPGRAITSPTVPLPSLTRPTLPTNPSTPTSTVSPPSVARLRAALPVYYVGHEVGSTGREVLVREFVPPTPIPESMDERVGQAVFGSLGENKGGGYPAAQVEATGIRTMAVGPTGIDVTITVATGPVALSELHVAALVYSAQAAASIGDVPVTLRFDDPGGRDLTPAATRAPLTRASFPRDVLASIWVDTPFDAQLLRTGTRLTVTGQASVFEAALTWELRRGNAIVRTGRTTAAAGAPARAAYTIRVGSLSSGTYTLAIRAGSAKDGSVAAERVVMFYVGIVPG